jgi:hypothetical protein
MRSVARGRITRVASEEHLDILRMRADNAVVAVFPNANCAEFVAYANAADAELQRRRSAPSHRVRPNVRGNRKGIALHTQVSNSLIFAFVVVLFVFFISCLRFRIGCVLTCGQTGKVSPRIHR